MNNPTKYYLHNVIYNMLYLTLASTVFQTYVLECGMPDHSVNMFLSVMQGVQLTTMLLFSKKLDKLENIIRFTSLMFIPAIPLTLLLIFMSGTLKNSQFNVTVLLYGTALLFYMGFALYSIICYKLPYHIMDIHHYGKHSTRSGIFSGVSLLIFSSLLAFWVKKYNFFRVMKFVYIAVLVLIPIYTLITLSLKKTHSNIDVTSGTKIRKINLFTYKPFYMLAIPNLLRGFCVGIVNLIISIGYNQKVLDANSATLIAIITNTVTFAACLVYPFIATKFGEYRMIPICSIGLTICMPLMFLTGGTSCFLIFYTLLYIFLIIINYAVPVAVTQVADYDIMGQYTSWRLLLNALGVMLSGFLCTPMLNLFGPVITMIITGLCQLVSGLVYYVYMKSNRAKPV